MARRKIIDPKKLLQMIEGGEDQKAILQKFGFSTATQLKVAYANAMMDTGKAAKIKVAGRPGAEKKSTPTATIGKRGSLTISKEQVADMGFKEGDNFEVRKTKAGISLKVVE